MKADLEAIVVAFVDDSPERSYYLDGDSGRVFNLLEDHDDPETQELMWALESDMRGRYIQIPKPSLEEALQEQDAFVETLEGNLKEKLDGIIESDHDGKKFIEFIKRDRAARETWRDYRLVTSRKRAHEWLQDLGIDES